MNRLGLKWTFSIPLWSQFLPDTPYFRENMKYFGLETVPIVADGIMYVTGPNQAFALMRAQVIRFGIMRALAHLVCFQTRRWERIAGSPSWATRYSW